MDIRKRKSDLRESMLSKRMLLTDPHWASLSEEVIRRLTALSEFKKADIIHTFISMNSRKEVDTHSLIRDMLNSGKKVLVPVTNFEDTSLLHAEIESLEGLRVNKWGVLEPEPVKESQLKPDLILVPMLSADLSFNRLGYGKGFYDRFLQTNPALKIGLIFEEFIVDEIPVEHMDQKLDILVTEKNTYHRNKE